MAELSADERQRAAATEKPEAEARKLNAEADDLARSPLQRPSAWVALGSGIVAIVAGMLTLPYGYYSKLKESADLSQKYSKLQADYLQQVSDMTQLQLRQSEKQAKDLADQIVARNKTITDLNRSKDRFPFACRCLCPLVRGPLTRV